MKDEQGKFSSREEKTSYEELKPKIQEFIDLMQPKPKEEE